MAFTLQPKPTFTGEVMIPTPNGEGKVTFEFKHMGRKALKAFFESLGEGDTARPDSEALLDLVSGWSGADEKFSPEHLDVLLANYPSSAKVIFDAYPQGFFDCKHENS